jgi:hypothetical protein
MLTTKLSQLTEEHSQLNTQKLSRESVKWILEKIKEIRRPVAVARELVTDKSRHTTNARLGRMYCFYYDPKTKEDLPYYDRFPLVLILDKYDDGFLALNIHYLPYRYRVAFLTKILRYAVLNKEDEVQRLRVTYDILTASKRLREFRPCLKRYLYSHMRSKLLTIKPEEWEVASFLPVQQFKGARIDKVWKESVQEIRKQ